ncbi:MAG: hypothetical protein JRJ59_06395 [Deltaproteobacteria bacterium]|nr:hypothetical protein [Deltaproteobacteria bacterium]
MGFTTWQDLYGKMLDDLATGNWRVASYRIGKRETQYRTFAEFKAALEYVKQQAAVETGTATGRTYAAQGGRGR